jgi:AcrR family transcriptional regulator
MDSTARPRSTRDRPAKAPLSEEAIVDAALGILRSDGLEAVTMRRVASELDTGPASLYVYIAGRDELRAAMLDRVADLVALEDPDDARWREQVHALLDAVLKSMEAHPGIATVALANPPTSPNSLRVAESLLGLLLTGGVSRQDAAWACDVLSLLTTASAIEADVWRARGDTEAESEWVDGVRRAFGSLPPSRFPLITGLTAELTSGSGDERFHFAIDALLDGMVARAARG